MRQLFMRMGLWLVMLFAFGSIDLRADTCKGKAQMEVMTMETNLVKYGFRELLSNTANPTIYFKKEVTTNRTKTYESHCFDCHVSPPVLTDTSILGIESTGDLLEFLGGSNAPTTLEMSGNRVHYHQKTPEGGNTVIVEDCTSVRSNGVWNPVGCVFPEYVTVGTLISSNLSSSTASLSFTNYFEEIATNEMGEVTGWVRDRQAWGWSTNLTLPYSLSTFLANASLVDWPEPVVWTNVTSSGAAKKGGANPFDGYKFTASLSKLKYRIAVIGPKGEEGEFRWLIRTTTPKAGGDGYDVTEEIVPATVKFTGEKQYIPEAGGESGANVEAPVPGSEVFVKLLPSGDCGCPKGTAEFENASVGARIGLGRMGNGDSAGFVYIHEETPSAALGTPAVLQDFVAAGVIILRTNGAIRQVKAPQSLIDVVTINGTKFELRYYDGGTLNTNGWYDPAGLPFVTWTFHDQVGNGTAYKITETRGGANRDFQFNWAGGDSSWLLRRPGGLKEDYRSSVSVGDLRTDTIMIKEGNGTVVYKELKRYRNFGGDMGEKLETRIISPDVNPLIYSWSYYTNTTTNGAMYGEIKSERGPRGDWTRYEYDTNARPTKIVRPFLLSPITAPDSQCDVTEYSYAPVGTGDNGSLSPDEPRMTVHKILDKEISRSYAVYRLGESISIQCQVAGAEWNSNQNLYTTNHLSAPLEFRGVINRTIYPDGTMSISEDPDQVDGSGITYVTYSGAPNAAFTAVTNGTKSVTTIRADGFTASTETFDIATNIKLSSEVYSDFDADHGPLTVTHLDGTSETSTYDCCGLASRIERDGSEVVYTRDSLHRVVGTTRAGITMINQLDAAGNVKKVIRQGTDGSTMTLGESDYDLAGRVTVSRDALGNPTSYQEVMDANGRAISTTILPNLGTIIQSSAPDGRLLSITGTATSPKRVDYGVKQDLGGAWRYVQKDIVLLANGTDSSEWVRTFQDMLGRTYKTEWADDATQESFFNLKGQLVKERDQDGIVTLYQYNSLGEVEYVVQDADADDVIDFGGTDRITQTITDHTTRGSVPVSRTRTYVWDENGTDDKKLVGTSESAVNGLQAWQTRGTATSHSVTEYLGDGVVKQTQTSPGDESRVVLTREGRTESARLLDANSDQVTYTTYGYDAHGRMTEMVDGRSGKFTTAYDEADRVLTTTTPPPDATSSAQTTTRYYDNMGAVWKVTQPDGTSVTNEFYLSGELKRTYGSRTYPVEYGYDVAGRMNTMRTWQSFASDSGIATTTWNYSTNRGFMVAKRYQDNKGPSYTYSSAGRLATRTWARGVSTTYGYDEFGGLETINYSDTTPDVTFSRNRSGQQATVVTSLETVGFTYNDVGQVEEEEYLAGPLNGLKVQRSYDSALRLRTLGVAGISATTTSFGYDAASRLKSVTNGVYSVEYGYAANSHLVQDMLFRRTNSLVMHTGKAHDRLNRLVQTATMTAAAPKISHTYAYNSANQRIRVTHGDGSYWVYEYDLLGQVKSGKKYWADGSRVAGQGFEYGFDDIGNRKTTKAGGDESGNGMRAATYTPNLLNQYTSRQVPGGVDIVGESKANATVTVNGATTYRKGTYFRKELSLNNASAEVYQDLEVRSTFLGTTKTNTGSLFLPKTPETYTYDDDGNLLADGRFEYTWDAENRLVGLETKNLLYGGPIIFMGYTYDWMGRRRTKDGTHRGGGEYEQAVTKFIYDGWNLLAELDGNNNLLRHYVWGKDLSGSMQVAGGVGGLLLIGDQVTNTNGPTAHFTVYDGNWNVTALMDADTGLETARYEYGPFGEAIRLTGWMADANPFRFSTKYEDAESGHLYYGHRYYNPAMGKWLSRDPIGEAGGLNLYGFAKNSTLDFFDVLGEKIEWHHMLPQAVFKEYMGKISGMTLADIDDPKYGWMMDVDEHKAIHGKGGMFEKYNKNWEEWFKREIERNGKVTKEQIHKRLAYLIRKSHYKDIYKFGVRATLKYAAWGTAKAAMKKEMVERVEKLLAKKATKTGAGQLGKGVPIVGWGAAAFFLVCDLADPEISKADAVQMNIPYYGVGYSIGKIGTDLAGIDAAAEKEITTKIYTEGDRTPPDFGPVVDDPSLYLPSEIPDVPRP